MHIYLPIWEKICDFPPLSRHIFSRTWYFGQTEKYTPLNIVQAIPLHHLIKRPIWTKNVTTLFTIPLLMSKIFMPCLFHFEVEPGNSALDAVVDDVLDLELVLVIGVVLSQVTEFLKTTSAYCVFSQTTRSIWRREEIKKTQKPGFGDGFYGSR